MARWRPNFRLNYWLCCLFGGLGLGAAGYGLFTVRYEWFIAGSAVGVIMLGIPRLRGPSKVPIPGMKNPLEGDFAPIGDPPLEEKVTVEEPSDPEQRPEPAPPQE